MTHFHRHLHCFHLTIYSLPLLRFAPVLLYLNNSGILREQEVFQGVDFSGGRDQQFVNLLWAQIDTSSVTGLDFLQLTFATKGDGS